MKEMLHTKKVQRLPLIPMKYDKPHPQRHMEQRKDQYGRDKCQKEQKINEIKAENRVKQPDTMQQ